MVTRNLSLFCIVLLPALLSSPLVILAKQESRASVWPASLTADQARQKISDMGLRYSEDTFVKCAGDGNGAAVELFLVAEMNANAKDRWTSTALMSAAFSGHASIVKLLLSRGARVDEKGGLMGQSALMCAAAEAHIEVMKVLLVTGADVNAKDQRGHTPLICAAESGEDEAGEAVELLLANGADRNAKNTQGDDALAVAALWGRRETVELLKKAGATESLEVALMLAVNQDDKDDVTTVRALLRKGADPSRSNRWGYRPLEVAARLGHLETASVLVEKGANVNAKNDKTGDTALSQSASQGHLDVVKFLIGKGADVNAKNKDGQTPLMFASGFGHVDVIKLLVAKGADINARGNEGDTPLSWAAKYHQSEVIDFLRRAGAKQ